MTDDLTLNMDAYLPLRDVVFNTLREAILKGDLKPGERLMELQLACYRLHFCLCELLLSPVVVDRGQIYLFCKTGAFHFP